MSDIQLETRDKMRRSLTQEFSRMEDDFDVTRDHRVKLVNKLMGVAEKVTLVDENGNIKEDTDSGIKIISTTLKALSDMEKANGSSILLKLKQSEQEIASSAAAKDRIRIILEATAPGRIETTFPSDELESHLSEMFDKDIKDFETKENSKDISD